MTSNDLFSFLDNDNDTDNSDSEIASNVMQVDSVSHAELTRTPPQSSERSVPPPELKRRIKSPPLSEDELPSKRQRLEISSATAPAVVVDEFETEAKREIAASAGLTGATEVSGSRLELRHQVRLQGSIP